jgi:hypothetical protein
MRIMNMGRKRIQGIEMRGKEENGKYKNKENK